MINIVIFEDDKDFTQDIINLIKKTSNDYNIGLVSDKFEDLHNYILLLEKPTIFILDIMFNKQSLGFKMADVINNSNLKSIIIFITNYPAKIFNNSLYKIKAFNVILKSSQKFDYELIYTLESALKQISYNTIIISNNKYTTTVIDIDSILYIETIKNKNKIRVFTNNGSYELKNSLYVVLKGLPPYFVRCHHSYIVNVKQITSIDDNLKSITMKSGAICYYSYTKKNKLKNSFNFYIAKLCTL